MVRIPIPLRRFLGSAGIAASILLVSHAGAAAQPCIVGCASSSSCAGEGGNECTTTCTWNFNLNAMTCFCSDARCPPKLAAIDRTGFDVPYVGPGYLVASLGGNYLIVDCDSNLHGVAFQRADMHEVRSGLARIRLEPRWAQPAAEISAGG